MSSGVMLHLLGVGIQWKYVLQMIGGASPSGGLHDPFININLTFIVLQTVCRHPWTELPFCWKEHFSNIIPRDFNLSSSSPILPFFFNACERPYGGHFTLHTFKLWPVVTGECHFTNLKIMSMRIKKENSGG